MAGLGRLSDGAAEEVDGVASEAESGVGVDGGGDGDADVAEKFLDDDDVDAPYQEELAVEYRRSWKRICRTGARRRSAFEVACKCGGFHGVAVGAEGEFEQRVEAVALSSSEERVGLVGGRGFEAASPTMERSTVGAASSSIKAGFQSTEPRIDVEVRGPVFGQVGGAVGDPGRMGVGHVRGAHTGEARTTLHPIEATPT